jgi:hypothetical protein
MLCLSELKNRIESPTKWGDSILQYYREEDTNFVPYRRTLNALVISDSFLYSFIALRACIFSILKYFNPTPTRVVDGMDVYFYDENGVLEFMRECMAVYREHYNIQ